VCAHRACPESDSRFSGGYDGPEPRARFRKRPVRLVRTTTRLFTSSNASGARNGLRSKALKNKNKNTDDRFRSVLGSDDVRGQWFPQSRARVYRAEPRLGPAEIDSRRRFPKVPTSLPNYFLARYYTCS